MTDLIPGEIDAPAAKRGGWSYASDDLTETLAGADVVRALIYAPFTAGAQLVGITTDFGTASKCVQIVSTSSTTDRGTSITPAENPSFYLDNVIFCSDSGSGTPQTYDGSNSVASLTGSPPGGRRSTVYKDRLVLANTTANTNRVWFSEAGDINDWDTTDRWIDTTADVSALYALRNSILVFHPRGLERIIGSIPPPGSDMFLQPVFDTGTHQATSLAGTDQFVCFANASGVYQTDGSQVVDMTRAGGINDLWQSRCAAASNLDIAGGYFRGYYWVTLRNGNTTTLDTFAVHVDTKRWLRFTNLTAHCFARAVGTTGGEELYWGDSSEARANTLSGIFSPTSSTKNDGDGTAVGFTLELPYVGISQSKGRLKRAYVGYDLRDAASDNPTIAASYIKSPEATSYTSITGALAETTEKAWVRRAVNKATFGIGLKLAQTTASAQTRLYEIGFEGHPREGSRVT